MQILNFGGNEFIFNYYFNGFLARSRGCSTEMHFSTVNAKIESERVREIYRWLRM
jgi:hypothetical protein